MSTAKAIFRILTGLEIGSVRLPLREFTKEQTEALRKDFQAAGLIDIAKPRED